MSWWRAIMSQMNWVSSIWGNGTVMIYTRAKHRITTKPKPFHIESILMSTVSHFLVVNPTFSLYFIQLFNVGVMRNDYFTCKTLKSPKNYLNGYRHFKIVFLRGTWHCRFIQIQNVLLFKIMYLDSTKTCTVSKVYR